MGNTCFISSYAAWTSKNILLFLKFFLSLSPRLCPHILFREEKRLSLGSLKEAGDRNDHFANMARRAG